MDKKATEILRRFEAADEYRYSYEQKWDDLYDMYRFKIKKMRPGRANFYIPHAFSNVETVFPRMTAQRPRLNIKPRGPQDVEPAKIMQKLIDYAWERASLDDVIRRWVKSTLIYGTGIVKVTWQKKTENKKAIRKVKKKDGSFEYEEYTTPYVKYDDVKVANLDLRDVYVDPDAVTIQDAKFVIHRYWATRSELESNPNYRKSDLKKVVYGADNKKIARGLSERERKELAAKSLAEVLEYWEDNRLVVVAGGVVLRDEENPYYHKRKPFVAMVDQIDDQSFYGIGEIEPIEGLQRELNTLRNQRMDFNNLILNPTFKVLPNAVTDPDSIQFTPGNKIFLNTADPTAISPIDMPRAPFSSYKEEETIRIDLQTITGVSDYSRGTEATKLNETATGISLIQEAANERFRAKLRNMEQAISEMTQLMVALYQQFITKEKVFRITEDETDYFESVKPEDIVGEFDIYVERNSTTPSNKMQLRQEELNKYNVLMANPLIQGSPRAQIAITRSLLSSWEDPQKEEVIEGIAEAAEMSAMNQQAQMLERQIAQEQAELSRMGGAPEGEAPEGGAPQELPVEGGGNEGGQTFPTE